MSNGHTPGPWRMDHDGSNWMVVTDDYPEMVDVWGFNGMPAVEVVANARLIAAAPELLEALSNLLSVYAKPDELICCSGHECGCMGASVYEQAEHYARAAIAKARGTPC